jgi:hypothetical protein
MDDFEKYERLNLIVRDGFRTITLIGIMIAIALFCLAIIDLVVAIKILSLIGFTFGMANSNGAWWLERARMNGGDYYNPPAYSDPAVDSFEIPPEGSMEGSAEAFWGMGEVSGKFYWNSEALYRREYEIYRANMDRAGKEYVGYQQFRGVVRRAEASEYTADAARSAKEYTALQSYLASVRGSEAKEYGARMGLKGQELQAFAKRYVAETELTGKQYVADRQLEQGIGVAKLEYQGKVMAAELGLRGEQAKAFATQYASKQARMGQQYAAQQAKQASFRESAAKEYTSREQRRGQVGAAALSAGGDVVSSGFGSMMAGKHMGEQWAWRTDSMQEAAPRHAFAIGVFILGLIAILIGMYIAGFPILEGLSNVVVSTYGRAVGLSEAISHLGESGNIHGIEKLLADGAASVGGGVSALFTAMLDRIKALFTAIWDWLCNLLHGVDTESVSTVAQGSLSWTAQHIFIPLQKIFGF